MLLLLRDDVDRSELSEAYAELFDPPALSSEGLERRAEQRSRERKICAAAEDFENGYTLARERPLLGCLLLCCEHTELRHYRAGIRAALRDKNQERRHTRCGGRDQ